MLFCVIFKPPKDSLANFSDNRYAKNEKNETCYTHGILLFLSKKLSTLSEALAELLVNKNRNKKGVRCYANAFALLLTVTIYG